MALKRQKEKKKKPEGRLLCGIAPKKQQTAGGKGVGRGGVLCFGVGGGGEGKKPQSKTTSNNVKKLTGEVEY